MRVLLVEDDVALHDLVARGLRAAGLAVDTALDGHEAVEKIGVVDYDVIVLDRDLPGVHGDDICRMIVEQPDPKPRVVMLTAFGQLDDRVEGLELGADDYLAKPFAMRELVARVRSAGRRAGPAAPPIITIGDIEVDSNGRTVRRAGRNVELSPKEFGVLELLMTEAPGVVSAEALLDHVWDENADPFTSAVRVTVANLRRKLGDPSPIRTHHGVGYSVACDDPG